MKRFFIITLYIAALFAFGCSGFNEDRYSFKQDNEGITITSDSIALRLTVYRNDIIRVDYLSDPSQIKEEQSLSVILKPDTNIRFRVKENKDYLRLITNGVIAEVVKNPFKINFYDRKGQPLLLGSRSYQSDVNAKTSFFRIQENDHFYGMGQKSIPVDRKGYAFESYNVHIGGYTRPYTNMQLNIPFIYSPTGWGVFFDNTWPGYFDLGKTDPSEWYYTAGGGDYTYYFVRGDKPQDLLRKYFDLTGYFPMFPKWTLGLLQSKCAYENDRQVYAVLDSFEKYGLPLDAIILDAYWFGGYKAGYPHNMGNFTWLKSNFPDHKEYLAHLKSRGVKTILINEPYINLGSENYRYLKGKNWLVKQQGSEEPFVFSPFWAGDASLLDITNPDARDWLWNKLRDILDEGVDGLWIDLTEPEHPVPDGLFYMGSERQVHNIYSMFWTKMIWEGYQRDFPERRVYNLTRSGFAGIQRYGAMTWSGDASKTWNAFKIQIPMLIGTSISGMPYFSSDIGGFTNTHDVRDGSTVFTNRVGDKVITTPEMYTRWFEFGVFSPLLRPHSGEEQSCEPFAFDEMTGIITSSYLKLRYRLIPYLYSYMYRTSTTGEPLIKPLFFLFDDPKAAQYQDTEYMFGNEFLVAPVTEEGQVRKTIYLPQLEEGFSWIDYWTDESLAGGNEYSVKVPVQEIPLFVKQPAIIPMAKLKKYVDESPDDTLTVDIYPGGHAEFLLYEDDGATNNYLKKEYAITRLTTEKTGGDILVKIPAAEGNYPGMVSERTWLLAIHLVKGFDEVSVNGIKISPVEYVRVLSRNTYYYDLNSYMLVLDVGGSVREGIIVRIKI